MISFLKRAIAFYARHGITVEQLLTDNGPGYRSAIHAIACRALAIRHLRTRAYRPQTNRSCTYCRSSAFTASFAGLGRRPRRSACHCAVLARYSSPPQRVAALRRSSRWRSRSQLELATVEWVAWFNHQRLHEALGDIPPVEFEQNHTAPITPISRNGSVASSSARAADGRTTRRLDALGVEFAVDRLIASENAPDARALTAQAAPHAAQR